MTNLIPFTFDDTPVRVLDRVGDPWFVLADVCRVLEHSNPTVAASRLDDDEKDTLNNNEGIAAAQVQTITIINESGLYSLVMTSRKPAAKRFKKWVTAEVLPQIRRTGTYGTAPAIPDLDDPALLQRLLIEHAGKRILAEQRADAAEAAIEVAQPKVEFYDKFVDADGLYTLHEAARILGMGFFRFRWFLQDGYMLRDRNNALLPYEHHRKAGLFAVRAADGGRRRTFITPKGLQFLADKMSIKLDRQPERPAPKPASVEPPLLPRPATASNQPALSKGGAVTEAVRLSPPEVSKWFDGKISPRTLANWRSRGGSRGPEYVKMGGRVLYPLDKLIEWERNRTFKGTDDYE